ncbi:MAG TPA: gluconate 2-dehydrogenase subunit 3 family protein [Gemmatimonadaceae bacterium]|nr:gluconate 2-dehydrogenase subunit 3 family protein [Gemmatimonadaceae bacterium]
MSDMDRRDAVKALAMLPFALKWDLTAPQLERASRAFQVPQGTKPVGYVPKFFTKSEWQTVKMLADYIIPRDERSGSASDARVPEYMDWLMNDREASLNSKTSMRGGLAWLDLECSERFGKTFVKATDAQRRQVLDDIAWPKKARPELAHGVTFFNRFRDLTASGFFSSEMGYKDVRFMGNVFNPDWNGCPPEAMAKLGVSHELMKKRVPVQRG